MKNTGAFNLLNCTFCNVMFVLIFGSYTIHVCSITVDPHLSGHLRSEADCPDKRVNFYIYKERLVPKHVSG